MKRLELPPQIGPVSGEVRERLVLYHGLLLKWQQKINLISPNTVQSAWERHFIDSAQLAPLLPQGGAVLYDLGSGAGFPGMVLAILRPDLAVTLIESDAKKCAFLAAVSRETGTGATVCNERIEVVSRRLPPPDIVTARALAPLPVLLDYCEGWLQTPDPPLLLFPKGGQYRAETDAARAGGWDFHQTETASLTETASRILTLSGAFKKQPSA